MPLQHVADTDAKPALRPIIEEIIRTRYYPNHVTLLVDRVSMVKASKDSNTGQAFRLWLSDGVKCIQATVKQDVHPLLSTQAIRGGSFVSISNYRLERLRRVRGSGEVWVLLVRDMIAIAHDQRGHAPLEVEVGEFAGHNESQNQPNISGSGNQKATERAHNKTAGSEASSSPNSEDFLQYDAAEKDYTSIFLQDELVDGLPDRAKHRLEQTEERNSEPPGKRLMTESLQRELADSPPRKRIGQKKTISRPLNITPLSQLIGSRVVRNKTHDVLAIVTSIDENVISRRGMPDQRNLRITDDSITKLVQLTVFVDASSFEPTPGTVALFRNVTTHEWDGGSLKAYQRDCARYHWFFPNPDMVEGSRVEALKRHWAENVSVQSS